MACALCACDLHDKIVNPDSVARSESNINDYVLPAASADYILSESDDDYIQYANMGDYSAPIQKSSADKIQKKQDIKVKEAESIVENKIPEAKPKPPVFIQQPSEPDDILLVPAKVAKTQPKPVIVKPLTDEIIVEKGDTVYSLSKKHNIVLRDLVDANNLNAPFAISVGQRLKIPNTRIHVVAASETLYSISRRYSVDLNSLAMENKIAPPYALSIGQKLRLPARLNVSTPTPVTAPIVVAPVQVSVPSKPVVTTAPASVPTKPIVDKSKNKAMPVPQTTVSGPKLITEKPRVSSAPAKPLPAIFAQKRMSFAWPVRGKILSGFGYKKNGLYNDGINIGAAMGTNVKASETGAVAYAGNELKGMGNLIIIQHANGWMSVYAHLDTMNVRRGARVAIGEKIGTIGKTGKVSEPQLHFEIRKGTKAYNPQKELK